MDVRKYSVQEGTWSFVKKNFYPLIVICVICGLFSAYSIYKAKTEEFPITSNCEYYDKHFNEIHSDFIYGVCPTYEVITDTNTELEIRFKNEYIGSVSNLDTFVPTPNDYANPSIENSKIEELVDVSVFYNEDGNIITYYNQTTLVTTMTYNGDTRSHYASYVNEINYTYTDELLSIIRDRYYHYELNSGNSDVTHYVFLPDDVSRVVIEVSSITGEILKDGDLLFTVSDIDKENKYLLVTDGEQTSEYNETEDEITWNIDLLDERVSYRTYNNDQIVPLLQRYSSNPLVKYTVKYDIYDALFTPYIHIEPDNLYSHDLFRLGDTEFGYILENMNLDKGSYKEWNDSHVVWGLQSEWTIYFSDYRTFFSNSRKTDVVLENNVILEYLLKSD